MSTQLYYILSLEHGPWDGEAMWWGPSHRGYTRNLRHAGLYDATVADAICRGANAYLPEGKLHEIKVPIETARQLAREVPTPHGIDTELHVNQQQLMEAMK